MRIRAFIAVDTGEGFRPEAVLGELRASGAELRLVEPHNMHITLRFLGEIDEGLVGAVNEAMVRSAEGVAPFDIRFRGLGAFPSESFIRVVWVGLSGAGPLAELARRLDAALAGLVEENRGGFSPHITLARVKSRRGLERLRAIVKAHSEDDFGSLRVERIVLKKSVLGREGPTYSDLNHVELRG
ncbi:MAG: RNA 2',3'-cyclic phosphodiesterase [Thermoplasmatota archaeon]